jgi:hypothetical protein
MDRPPENDFGTNFYQGTVDGTTFVEVDDGRRIPGQAPF